MTSRNDSWLAFLEDPGDLVTCAAKHIHLSVNPFSFPLLNDGERIER